MNKFEEIPEPTCPNNKHSYVHCEPDSTMSENGVDYPKPENPGGIKSYMACNYCGLERVIYHDDKTFYR